MAVTLKKIDIRGGKRKPSKLTTQGRLLQAIWEKFGGIVACSKKLGVQTQVLVNWKHRKVPLEMIGHVSETLNVPKAALNFNDVSLYDNKEYSWYDLISQCKLGKEVTYELMSLPPPKVNR